ncbi:MAG TPA: hypothetical protein VK689_19345, partial [Armatimonadota bacterium]|nr:hypothetical protein [Armatimonadota bacterium]
QDDEGRFALATKWEWTRFQEPDLPPSVLEGIIEDLIIRRKGDEVGAAAEQALSDAQQKRLYGLDPLGELKPWLEAVGYRTGSPDEEPDAEAEARFAAEAAGRREQVYRLDIQLRRRPSARKVLEVQGDTTLVDLDDTFRRAFGHDTMDHMGGFFVRAGGGRGRQTLATINPLGEVMDGEDMELAELDLEPEDEIAYVYDFGDWMEHTAMVKAVVPAEPGATYPREVELRARRGAKSPRGRRPETETEA